MNLKYLHIIAGMLFLTSAILSFLSGNYVASFAWFVCVFFQVMFYVSSSLLDEANNIIGNALDLSKMIVVDLMNTRKKVEALEKWKKKHQK